MVADLHRLDTESFWSVLDSRDRTRLPKSVLGMVDDPFRSLASELRLAGGYAKDTTPFSEFLCTDLLRRRIRRRDVEASFVPALERALQLAKGEDANYLPGWCGKVDR